MRKVVIFPLGLILIGIAAWHNSLQAALVFDDLRIAYDEVFSRSFSGFLSSFFPENGTLFVFRPLIHASLALNYFLGGTSPFGYHLFNLIFHLASACLVYGILRRLTGCATTAFVTAGLWMVHPLNTQAVTYMIQRCESWMGFFYLLMVYAFLRSFETKKPKAWLRVSLASLVFGMGCKEVIVTAPIMVLLLDRIFIADSWKAIRKKRGGYYGSLALLLGIYFYWHFFSGVRGRAVAASAGLDYSAVTPLEYVRSQAGVILHYLKQALWPQPLIFDYRWPVATTPGDYLIPGLIILALIGITAVTFRYRPKLAFAGIWFFGVLAPSSSVIPIEDLAAEHRMYLPLIAVIALAVVTLAKLRPRGLFLGTVTVLMILLSYLTWTRNQVYASEKMLWADTLEHKPGNGRAHNNYAMALARDGETDQALRHYLKAVELEPENERAYNNIGNLLTKQKNFEEAEGYFRKALEMDPLFAKAHNNYANLLAYQGRYEEAVVQFQKAVEINPRYLNAYFNMAQVLERLGRLEEAVEAYEAALAVSDDPRVRSRFDQLEGFIQSGKAGLKRS